MDVTEKEIEEEIETETSIDEMTEIEILEEKVLKLKTSATTAANPVTGKYLLLLHILFVFLFLFFLIYYHFLLFNLKVKSLRCFYKLKLFKIQFTWLFINIS